MVNLVQKSGIDAKAKPLAHQWDSFVRKNYERYQHQIDAQTYQLQRTQRYLFSTSYPKTYYPDIIRLNLLRKKQIVGEVTQEQVNLFKNINPDIADDFNRTFNGRLAFPKWGFGIGLGLAGYATVIKSTFATRLAFLVAPIFIDYIRISNDLRVEHRSLQLLNWVIGYRRAATFNQKHKSAFNSEETRKYLGQGSLVNMGRQLINLSMN